MMDASGRVASPPRRIGATTLLLSRNDVAAMLDPTSCVGAVEAAFRSLAIGDATVPMPMHVPADGGGFHVKAASLRLDRLYVVVKVNGNYPSNPARTGLPAIRGAVLLYDGADGTLLAILDSIEITLRRTAAASALAARYLARLDADSIAICGCGVQGRAHLVTLAQTMGIRKASVWDGDSARARAFASDMQRGLGIEVRTADTIREATRDRDIVVTTTSAQAPFLTRECVSAGTFVAAVGADSPQKSEIDCRLLAGSTIVVDSLEQCLAMGDLHHAVAAGVVDGGDVHAELGDLVTGRKPGRRTSEEIIVFDSTGVAIEDAAAAAFTYQRAVAARVGVPFELNAP